MTYTVNTFDVCQPGYERLRTNDEFILTAWIGRSSCKASLRTQWTDNLNACEREIDYGAVRKCVADFVKSLDMTKAVSGLDRWGATAYLYIQNGGDDVAL